jgi:hypothetical protein
MAMWKNVRVTSFVASHANVPAMLHVCRAVQAASGMGARRQRKNKLQFCSMPQ